MLSILALESDRLQFVRSAALVLENNLNPIRERASRVAIWLSAAPMWQSINAQRMELRITELTKLGLKNFDALHVASAEEAQADFFVSVDDRLLAAATRNHSHLRIKACTALECAREMSK